jgi:predicted DNA-binding protein (MmcQ/YjbR family)
VGGRDDAFAVADSLSGAGASQPFGEGADVFKVGGRIFAIFNVGVEPAQITLKCEPEDGMALRAEHPFIRPGYHMNKRHWITITMGEAVNIELVTALLTDAHRLVVESLPRRLRPPVGN